MKLDKLVNYTNKELETFGILIYLELVIVLFTLIIIFIPFLLIGYIKEKLGV